MKKHIVALALACSASLPASAFSVDDCHFFSGFSTAVALDRDAGVNSKKVIGQVLAKKSVLTENQLAAALLIVGAVYYEKGFQVMTPYQIGETYYDACIDAIREAVKK